MWDDSSDHEMPEVPSISSIRFCTNLQSIDFWWWSLEFTITYPCPWKHTDHRNLSPLLLPMWPACSCALWLMLLVVKTSDCWMFCSGCALWVKGWCPVSRLPILIWPWPINSELQTKVKQRFSKISQSRSLLLVMIFMPVSQFHIYLPCLGACLE